MPTNTITMDYLSHKTSEWMRDNTSHRGTLMSYLTTVRITRDGEVPFIRYVSG